MCAEIIRKIQGFENSQLCLEIFSSKLLFIFIEFKLAGLSLYHTYILVGGGKYFVNIYLIKKKQTRNIYKL